MCIRDRSKRFHQKLWWINIGAMALDLIWWLLAFFLWNKAPQHDELIWKQLSTMHSFSLFFSFINIVLRGGILAILYLTMKEEDRAFPSPEKPHISIHGPSQFY
eukprot:TRINITY_DN15245_c0_g1_i1.p2 TRINITY_DN15245_c0_g1~~TRINITY_DN15245_c0_g1_i1.p2  ORF type:complete len:104 (+),score=9.85 TRINITY_DN15245_c0_g1_i1:131-442(+)